MRQVRIDRLSGLPAILAFLLIACLLSGCGRPPPLVAPEGVTLTPLRTISTPAARVLLALSGVRGIDVAYAVDCYRMEYSMTGRDGRPERLSGLLALPRGAPAQRLASFQHGTATTRDAVPSKPDGTGLAAAILFAGNGYALVAPDYPGMGASPGRHPYYVREAIAPAVVAMIDVARQIPGVPDNPVFLSGFSEGGWASLAALELLEARGDQVFAVAPVAAPVDLSGVSLPAAMNGGAKSHTLYLAYAAWGQAAYYGQSLDSVLTPHYAAVVERLFAGASPRAILAGLPSEPRALFNAQFLEAYEQGRPHWFTSAFASADLTDLAPKAPVRLYYGSKDVDVVPQEAIAAAARMRARGGKATAIDVGPVGHDPSMLAAAPLILDWLRALEHGSP